MALYAISDLHLPLGIHKPMDIFGPRWENYVSRLEENWQKTVKPEDVVVLPGDFSWATYLDESIADFQFLNRLNGKKILLKGNHDYWWPTMNKLHEFVQENGFLDIDFLQNNSFMYGTTAICGTRGWIYSRNLSKEDQKIYDREVNRLELSINHALSSSPDEIYVFLHYPPITTDCAQTPMAELLHKYGVKNCMFGHIHAQNSKLIPKGTIDGIEYLLVSCDFCDFQPILLCE